MARQSISTPVMENFFIHTLRVEFYAFMGSLRVEKFTERT